MRSFTLGAVLLAAVLLSQAQGSFWPYIYTPVEKDLEDEICKTLGDIPLPFASDNFCNGTGFTSPGLWNNKCYILGYAEHTFQSFSNPNASCPALKQTPAVTVSLNGTSIPWTLADLRPLPASLPSSVLANEGPSMYWYWKNLYNFELWAPCAATNATRRQTIGYVRMANRSLDWLRPAKWIVLSTLWLRDGPQQAGVYWPFATILTKGTQLAIFIRGTETYQDWLTDFTYSENPTGSISLPGETHAGFTAITNTLWREGIRAALWNHVVLGRITSVSVAGHSLGAGVATLVAYAAQNYLQGQRRSRAVKVDAYLFAPPNAGDAVFVAAFNKLVNARRIPFQYDLIPQVPCTPTMAACNNTVVPTPNPNGTWQYSSVGGTLQLLPAGMPQQPQVWAGLSKIYPCLLEKFVLATHICSYACYFSQYVNDLNNNCLLWNTTAAAGAGTYCTSYPVTSGPQYPYVN